MRSSQGAVASNWQIGRIRQCKLRYGSVVERQSEIDDVGRHVGLRG